MRLGLKVAKNRLQTPFKIQVGSQINRLMDNWEIKLSQADRQND